MEGIDNVLLKSPINFLIPGKTLYPSGKSGVAFTTKEYKRNISKIGSSPEVKIRTSIYQSDNSAIGILMLNIKGVFYLSLLNYYDKIDLVAINKLICQDNIIFEFRKLETLKVGSQILINNVIKCFFEEYKEICLSKKSWNLKETLKLKRTILEEYDFVSLWMTIK